MMNSDIKELQKHFDYVYNDACKSCKWNKPRSKKDCPIKKGIHTASPSAIQNYSLFIVSNGHGGYRCRQYHWNGK